MITNKWFVPQVRSLNASSVQEHIKIFVAERPCWLHTHSQAIHEVLLSTTPFYIIHIDVTKQICIKINYNEIFPRFYSWPKWPKHTAYIQLIIHKSQANIYTSFWRFDLITRSSSEEAGIQFFRVLMRWSTDRRIKTRKNWVPASSDKDLVMRSKRQNEV